MKTVSLCQECVNRIIFLFPLRQVHMVHQGLFLAQVCNQHYSVHDSYPLMCKTSKTVHNTDAKTGFIFITHFISKCQCNWQDDFMFLFDETYVIHFCISS